MGSYKVTRGPHHDLTQQWRYLNLSKNSFYILFPAKGIVSSGQIISSRLKFVTNLFTRWPSTFEYR